jgi:hypothetical protein
MFTPSFIIPDNTQKTQTVPGTRFGPPFDESDSDLVLQSSSGVSFFVFKNILRMASPFFRSMFSLPQSKDTSGLSPDSLFDGIPCISMQEDTETLHRFLTLIFPVAFSFPTSFKEAILLLSALQKYQLDDRMGLLRKLLAGELSYRISKENAFEAFGLSHEHRLVEESLAASQAALERSLTFNDICMASFSAMSGAALSTHHYHRSKCKEAALTCLAELRESSSPNATAFLARFGCTHQTLQHGGVLGIAVTSQTPCPDWWWQHFSTSYEEHRARSVNAPMHAHLAVRPDVLNNTLRSHRSKGCGSALSPGLAQHDIEDITKDIVRFVQKAIEEVRRAC